MLEYYKVLFDLFGHHQLNASVGDEHSSLTIEALYQAFKERMQAEAKEDAEKANE